MKTRKFFATFAMLAAVMMAGTSLLTFPVHIA